jgi:predicted nucleic acid-binding Zn ribbon protein
MPRISHRALKSYIAQGGTTCPTCGSNDLTFTELAIDDGAATCNGDCGTCGASWKEAYDLVGVDADGQGFFRPDEHLSDRELVQQAMDLLDGVQWKRRRGEAVDAARAHLQTALELS